MSKEALRAFTKLLSQWRADNGITQEALARTLEISRKTYVLFESARWLPPVKERAFTLRVLHALDPALAYALLEAFGDTMADYAITVTADEADADAHAATAFDAAMFATAERFDLTPKELRPIVAFVLKRLGDSKVSMRRAAALANTHSRH